MAVLAYVIGTVAIVTVIWLLVRLKELIRRINILLKIPGPGENSKLWGVGLEVLCDEATLFKKLREWSKSYEQMYSVSMTYLFPAINIIGPEAVEQTISSTRNIKKSRTYNFLHRWLGEGLLTSTDSKWHSRRKIITPTFHFNILQQFVTTFNQETNKLVASLKKEVGKPSTNLIPYISEFTLYSITETSMGVSLDLKNKQDSSYINSIYKLGILVTYRLKRPWLYFNSLYYNLCPVGWKETGLLKTLHSFTDKIINERSQNFKKIEILNDENYTTTKKTKLAFLDLLLNAKVSDGIIDNEGIRDEVNTFMFEGHDTTAASLCFTLMLLANHRHYQDEIYEEIISVLGNSNKDPDFKELNELKLLERFIKESLRLYPSVPFIGRTVDADIMVNGYLVPKNTEIQIHIYDVHRNPKYWPDPEKFDPDRFLPENCIGRHPYAYIPFSAGPRNCIGQRFAVLELKTALCGIIRNYILEPIDTPETINMRIDLVLRTNAKSIKVKFCNRFP